MKRTITQFHCDDLELTKQKLLSWSKQFSTSVWLDSNQYPSEHSRYECILAVEALSQLSYSDKGSFEALRHYIHQKKDWLFGYLGYDLKNDIELLESRQNDAVGLPDLCFFQPKRLWVSVDNHFEAHYPAGIDPVHDWENIQSVTLENNPVDPESVLLKSRISPESYKEKAQSLLNNIHKGDIYEVNFCMEWYAHQMGLQPYDIYAQLNTISKAPFSALMQINDHFLMCASPERFLNKQGSNLCSQPIKGTAKREADYILDHAQAQRLANDPKEQAENIMIVDLVRNDLSKVAKRGSVSVLEKCKVYAFKQVYQMISTVKAQLDSNFDQIDALRSCFPMGSMTGAPKVRAMELIEEHEQSKRGLYSGALGYFNPNGDFDFNVVIRSLIYRADTGYLSLHVGSALTAEADPEKEYEECLLKAKAIRQVLEKTSVDLNL
ncbi:MAG: anthranilate synthase component I family protein [Flavobacteriaceae bacterium]